MIKLKDNQIYIIIALLVLIYFFALFKISGLLVIFGMFFLFFLPVYLVLRNLDLTQIEKIFFSFFIGLGLFPTMTYYLAILIGSIRWSILILFIILTGVGLIFNWKFSKKKSTLPVSHTHSNNS